MKKLFWVPVFILSFGLFNDLAAQETTIETTENNDEPPTGSYKYKTALGIRLSNNLPIVSNAITLKHFLNETTAVEAFFSFGDPMAMGAVVEIHKPFSTPGLQWFYGAGGYFGFGKEYDVNKARNVNTTYFGAQGVVGLDYKFASIPVNLSLDWKPELNLVSDIHFEPAAIAFSARFTFGK